MALSLGLPPVAVSNCRILCCPDVPLGFKAKRSSSELPVIYFSNNKQGLLGSTPSSHIILHVNTAGFKVLHCCKWGTFEPLILVTIHVECSI